MNVLILINSTQINEQIFDRAIAQDKEFVNDKNAIVTICDICDIDTQKKYSNWLRKAKKGATVQLIDAFSYSDGYDLVIVIGRHYDLLDFNNCAKVIKYHYTLKTIIKEEEEVWN